MDKTFGEIIALLLLDNIGDCPHRVFTKGECPDWVSIDGSCGIEVTKAYQTNEEMWASSLFGKKFANLRNKSTLSDLSRQCTFRKNTDFFDFNFKTRVLSRVVDNQITRRSIDDLTPDEIVALDDYVMIGSNTPGLSDPNGFANDTYKALESKLKKLNCNTEFESFKNNILFVFCSSLLYNPDKVDDICRRFVGRIKESIEKFHFVYVCSYGQIFKFDVRCESSSIFNINVESFEKKRDELLHSLLNYDYLSVDGKKLEIDLCSVLKNEALNLNIGPVKEITEQTLSEKISRAETTLDRIIGFINNSESKTGITLTMVGVILTVLFTLGGENIMNMLDLVWNDPGPSTVAFVLFFALSLLASSIGIYLLIKVLTPKLNVKEHEGEWFEKDSKIFFEKISKNNKVYSEYMNKLLVYSSEDYLNDLWSQIYVNSKICTKKFWNFYYGLRFAIPGLLSLLATVVVFSFLILG